MLFVLAVVAHVLFAAFLPFFLDRALPRWSKRRIVLLSALLVPALIIGTSVFLFADAALSSREQCGVDACGMMMAAAIYGLIVAAILYFVGMLIAVLGARFVGGPEADKFTDVFS